MHISIRNAIGIAATLAILVGAYAVASATRSFDERTKQREPATFRSFTVAGEGRVTVIPDIARFTYVVWTEGGRDVARVQRENAEHANRAIVFVKAQGVAAKDIHTITYRVEPRYQYFPCERKPGDDRPCRQPDLLGYTVVQRVAVKVRDFGKLGDLLSGVVRESANEVSELAFTIDDATALEQEARTQAITKAKEKAQAIARAGGFQLGRLLEIGEGFAQPISQLKEYDAEAVGRASLAALAPTIEPGSQEVVVHVTLKYEIQ